MWLQQWAAEARREQTEVKVSDNVKHKNRMSHLLYREPNQTEPKPNQNQTKSLKYVILKYI